MTLQIGAALRGGFDRLVGRTGGILILAYVLTYVVYQASFNGLIARAYASYGIDTAALQPVVGGPLWLQGAAVLACLLALTYLSIVAVRTFVAEATDAFPEGALSRGIALAMGNLVVGGIVFSIMYWIGLALLVVPGLFVLVSFLFMPIYVAAEGENFVSGLRKSWALTDGHRLRLFALLLVLMAVGGAIGFVAGFGSAMIAVVGGPQALFGVAMAVVVAPLSLYGLAVTTAAYAQLRDEASDGFDGGASAPETPSTPA